MSEPQEFAEEGIVDEIEEAAPGTAEETAVEAEGSATDGADAADDADETASELSADDAGAVEEPEELPEPDQRLLDAHDLALAALHEITPATSVGPAAGYSVERDGVVSLRFENTLLGYPGWFWTVSLAIVEGSEPTVLEVELLPGDDALLAPEWVPWAVRLKEYQVAQAAAAQAAAEAAEADEDNDLHDVDDLDADDFDEDGSDILHAGDVDGIDIDHHDPDAPEFGDEDEDQDEPDEDDEDDDSDDEDPDDEDLDDEDPDDEDDDER